MSRIVEVVAPSRLGSSFRWLLGASWLVNLGDGLTTAAGPLLVASQTHSPALVASAAFLQRLPWLLFGLYAGVVADRVNRRTVVLVTDGIRVVVLAVLVLTIVTHAVSIAVVLGALFVLGTNETFCDTTTSTLMPMLVAKTDLGIANARTFSGMIVGSQMIGPPIGAALFTLGMAVPFSAELVCVLAAAVLVSRIQLPPVAATAPRSGAATEPGRVRDEIRDGVRWLWSHPAVRTLAITIFTFNITYGAAWSVLVLYTRQRLDLGEFGFGLVTTALAVGGLLGTAAYGWLERHVSLGNIMRVGLIIETLTHLSLALLRWAPLALVVFAVFGAHAFVWGTTSVSVRQRAVPAEYQGRVGSVYLMGMFGGLVIGAALGGGIAEVWGITAPFWFAFVGSAVILVLIWRSLARIAHEDELSRAGSVETRPG